MENQKNSVDRLIFRGKSLTRIQLATQIYCSSLHASSARIIPNDLRIDEFIEYAFKVADKIIEKERKLIAD